MSGVGDVSGLGSLHWNCGTLTREIHLGSRMMQNSWSSRVCQRGGRAIAAPNAPHEPC
ncbi:hypothetical protein RR11_1187 [Ruegeria sp. R11]|nr:hypothetical protein RR11_1187 [Ruegeria sp. R11]